MKVPSEICSATISPVRAAAFRTLEAYYANVFGNGRSEYAIPKGVLSDVVKQRRRTDGAASRRASPGKLETETADDFTLDQSLEGASILRCEPGENSREPSKVASYSPFLWLGTLVWLTALISVSCAMSLVFAKEATF